MLAVSVIIIGRNEAKRIERCLRSVFASIETAFGRSDAAEVIYVDSASQDETVEVASRFPIRIFQLHSTWKLTPSAGRYIGYQHAAGEFLLFVDGDTVMQPGWLKASCDFLEKNSEFGGVGGIMDEAYEGADGEVIAVAENSLNQTATEKPQIVTSLPGIATYRRAAMEQAGTFNPYLPTGEECELALRIRQAGFLLGRINEPMCVTHSMPRETIREVVRRSRSHLYDYGTTLRYCLKSGCGWRFSVEQMWFVWGFLGAVLALVAALAAAIWIGSPWLVLGAAAAVAVFLILKRRHPAQLALSLLKRSLMTYRTFESFLRTQVAPIEAYPTDVLVVK